MKHPLILLLLFVCHNLAFGQSGYLGSLNNLSVSVKAVPSIKTKMSLNNTMTESKRSLRLANLNYEISYSRIISKKIELSIAYGFSKMKAITEGMTYHKVDTFISSSGFQSMVSKPLNVLQDPHLNLHQFAFDLRIFRLGSLAPTGKYVGIGIEFGLSNLDRNIIVGKSGSIIKSGPMASKYEVLESEIFSLDNSYKANYIQLNASIGRNYPITQNLMIGVGMTSPIFTTYGYDGSRYYGFNIDNTTSSFDEKSNLRNMVMYT